MDTTEYDDRYAGPDYYWGLTPSAMCDRIIALVGPSPAYRPRLIDLGCGEGRNAVYLARHGFDVVGLDLSPNGLCKARQLARRYGVSVRTIQADIRSYELCEQFDVVFSTGTLQYLAPEDREGRYANYKRFTSAHGINALSVFVDKPFIAPAPDAEAGEHRYRSGELLGYYWDWEMVVATEEIVECHSGGVPHQHAVARMIARPHSQ